MTRAELTYDEVGGTFAEAMPSGYRHVERRVRVGAGEASYRALVDGIMRWDVQRGAGLEVRAEGERVGEGVGVVCVTRVGPVRVKVPCRVVAVVDGPRRGGFAYGTLPGHPARGEEAFLAEIDADGEVWFTVKAFSRPGTWWAKLGAPVTRLMQRRVTEQYVAAARRFAG
ncbi:DUF1990 family protein [Yinghuangia seranimata]|uniref:DUF1990 family protein n=1 Tax=Yinghuangia seranimata TaxID=408067 RepID=UPI00248CE31A|nr:DUF1990 domain-containing protein [Yinghuangia seranimata]MDI2126817.1 DUF1990 domain-containing protein [Yinghuangia seranimata]